MTEKEKMLAGQAYDAWEPELLALRANAKKLCHQFNQLCPSENDKRNQIINALISPKDKCHIEANFFCDYGINIEVGDNFYANHNLVILDVCKVKVGNNVMFGPNVMLSTATHPLDAIERRSTEYGKPIVIGNDVWLGGNVSILPGITIGDKAVIGAGSVVTKDIAGNGVYAGNPCKFIKPLV
ncbi:sugar O-acetyltransferase [Shewanella sp. KT0246]|uniref:sugar O-acetyltransferase n=1 Tax=Shewanella sp. KT0246 TaxID=2815912 RepID=UPI001BB9EC3E|nr:sugar O-acetyltransferase [Shewanella sp. KT0246]GIU54002.1 maltose O-acetyltransferase [Shewanella sp. KT0246]